MIHQPWRKLFGDNSASELSNIIIRVGWNSETHRRQNINKTVQRVGRMTGDETCRRLVYVTPQETVLM